MPLLNSNYIDGPFNCTKQQCGKLESHEEYCHEEVPNNKTPTLSFKCKKGSCNKKTGICDACNGNLVSNCHC